MRCDFDKSKKIRFECLFIRHIVHTTHTPAPSNKCVTLLTYLCGANIFFLLLESSFPDATATGKIFVIRILFERKNMYEKKTRTKFNILDLDFTFVGFNLVWQFYSINFSDILLSFALSLKNCSPKKKNRASSNNFQIRVCKIKRRRNNNTTPSHFDYVN